MELNECNYYMSSLFYYFKVRNAGRTDRQTVEASYRDAWTHFKMIMI